jgi:hypothetical protein
MLAEEEAAEEAAARTVVEAEQQGAKEEEERAGREAEQHAVFDAEMMEAVRGMDSVVPYTLRSPYAVLLLYKVRDKDSRDQHLLAIYHGMDSNDDGTVTRKEVSAALQQHQVVVAAHNQSPLSPPLISLLPSPGGGAAFRIIRV